MSSPRSTDRGRRRSVRNPDTQSNRVVLPAPFWPMSPRISPSRSSRSTRSTAVIPPKRLVTPRHSSTTARVVGTVPAGRPARPASRRHRRPSGTVGRSSAPAMNTERRMSGRSSSSRVEPVKRNSPFSMNTARSARFSATLIDCSTTTTVSPCCVDPAHDVDQLPHDGGCEAERQLVDEQQLRVGDERLAHGQHLLLAAGQVAGQRSMRSARRGNSSSTRSSASCDAPRGRPCAATTRPAAGSPAR